jgi:hypothetical protein
MNGPKPKKWTRPLRSVTWDNVSVSGLIVHDFCFRWLFRVNRVPHSFSRKRLINGLHNCELDYGKRVLQAQVIGLPFEEAVGTQCPGERGKLEVVDHCFPIAKIS